MPTPGTLLLGTSQGRLLAVPDAAPLALPFAAWVGTPSAACIADAAELPALQAGVSSGGRVRPVGATAGAVVVIDVGIGAVSLLLGGTAPGVDASLVWLDASEPSCLARASVCVLRGVCGAQAACVSPSGAQIALRSANGMLAIALAAVPRLPQEEESTGDAVAGDVKILGR